MWKDLVILAVIGIAAWVGYVHFEDRIRQALGFAPSAPPAAVRILPEQFACDGRIYCSQMTSCEEAKFFQRNCPRVKMELNGDGHPCERQWCK